MATDHAGAHAPKHLTASGTETPRTAAPPGVSLEEFGKTISKPVIAVDMDDVLSETNAIVAQWHNDVYGTNMTLDDFYYYYYWMNPYWGDPTETIRKVEEFWKTDYIERADPVPGTAEGLRALKELGFALVIVTARQVRELERSLSWIDRYFPGVFETMICTGQSQETLADKRELVTKLSKADVCKKLGARFLVDDSMENAWTCVTARPPVRVLLFGDYSWNKRRGQYEDIKNQTSFEERLKREGGREFWKEEEVEVPADAPLTRVRGWGEIVEWVKSEQAAGRL